MLIPVTEIAGRGRIPIHRTSASDWLVRSGIGTQRRSSASNAPEYVELSDLPEPERRAVIEAQLTREGLTPGTYDDDAHAAFMAAPATMRAKAERKAQIAATLVAARRHSTGGELAAIIRSKHGSKGTSNASLKRLAKAIEGLDPINFAPALLDGYKGRTVTADVSDEAWRMFLSLISRASSDWTLKSAWRDVRDTAPAMDWTWPSYPTTFRRWQALPESNRQMLLEGKEHTVKSLTQPVMRNKTTIAPLAQVSLDGRTQDFWVDFGDGRAVRPVMLALVDVASNLLLDYILCRSENAADTVQLIKRTCQTYGIFDRLYTDNGSAFAGHLVAGGERHRFRNGGRADAAPTPPGICEHLGIATTFALPGNAKAKTAERTFASLSRQIDDRPEFEGAHAGHTPGASPKSSVVPVPFETAQAIVRREVDRYNAESGRQSQGARGRSYRDVFEAGMAQRVVTFPTERQLYLSGLIYKRVAVDRYGRMHINGWTYGGPDTQDVLLRYHGKGQRVLLGRDPQDFGLPAIAYNADARLICEGIEPVKAGAYDSTDGIRQAATNRKRMRDTLAAHEEANRTFSDVELAALLDRMVPVPSGPVAPTRKVVGGRFGGPLPLNATPEPADPAPTMAKVPEEYIRNFDTYLAKLRRDGKGA